MKSDDRFAQIAPYVKQVLQENPALTELEVARAAVLKMRADTKRRAARKGGAE